MVDSVDHMMKKNKRSALDDLADDTVKNKRFSNSCEIETASEVNRNTSFSVSKDSKDEDSIEARALAIGVPWEYLQPQPPPDIGKGSYYQFLSEAEKKGYKYKVMQEWMNYEARKAEIFVKLQRKIPPEYWDDDFF